MPIPFLKIEGLGNDYLYVENKAITPKGVDLRRLSRIMSDRRRGAGSDGIIVVERLGPDSASMRIFNIDGSEAKFCGNGLRGMALFMRAYFKLRGTKFKIMTSSNMHVMCFESFGTAIICKFINTNKS